MRHIAWESYGSRDEGYELARVSCQSGALLEAHDHDYYEFFVVEDGTCTHLLDGGRTDLDPGSLVFIRPHDLHQLRADRTPFTICNLSFNPLWVGSLQACLGEAWDWAWPSSGPPRVLSLSQADAAWFRSICDALWQRRPDRLTTAGVVVDLLRQVMPLPEATRAGSGPAWLRKGLSRLRDPMVFLGGVSALAAAAGVSREHLARACRRNGMPTPGRLIADARLDYACRMLRYGDVSIAEVAYSCGYGGPAQFYRRFVARFGCPPAAWRRRRGVR